MDNVSCRRWQALEGSEGLVRRANELWEEVKGLDPLGGRGEHHAMAINSPLHAEVGIERPSWKVAEALTYCA